jgi:hypothetical protein
MQQTTYSFLDSVIVIAHPLLDTAAIVLTGDGVGKATVAMSENKTAIDIAADGAPMVSKIAGEIGTVTIDVQQTSASHKKLLNLYNKLKIADTLSWAQASITMRNVVDGTSHIATGVAFQKVPDKGYEKEGKQVSWVFMCADIQNLTI